MKRREELGRQRDVEDLAFICLISLIFVFGVL